MHSNVYFSLTQRQKGQEAVRLFDNEKELKVVDIFRCIAGLSYMGDVRLDAKDKVDKIVSGAFQEFVAIYRSILEQYVDIHIDPNHKGREVIDVHTTCTVEFVIVICLCLCLCVSVIMCDGVCTIYLRAVYVYTDERRGGSKAVDGFVAICIEARDE